jgi:hypothetical protein
VTSTGLETAAVSAPAISAQWVKRRDCANPRLSVAVRIRCVKRFDVRVNPLVVGRRGGIDLFPFRQPHNSVSVATRHRNQTEEAINIA